MHEYNREATERLLALCFKIETPLAECIKLVCDEGADPNVAVGSLTLLEEAVLRQNTCAVEIFIKYGADVFRIAKKRVVDGIEYGRTLLHLAVYPPQKVQKLLDRHKQEKMYNGKENRNQKSTSSSFLARQEAPNPEIARKEALKKELYKLEIGEYITCYDSWTILDQSPFPLMLELLFKHGLGKNEINVKKKPGGLTPYEIACFNRNALLKVIEAKNNTKVNSNFHDGVKKLYDRVVALFEDELGITKKHNYKEVKAKISIKNI